MDEAYLGLPCSLAELQRIFLLQGVDLIAVEGLLCTCPVFELPPGTLLIEPGDSDFFMYLLLEGRLRVHLESPLSAPIAVLGDGESVGELALIDRKPRSAWVVVDLPSRVIEVNKEVFWSLISASHEVAINLLAILAERLRGNNFAISASLHLQQEYRRHATLDALTGLYNRRWLEDMLPRQLERSVQDCEALSVLMVDIDHFKRFNDNYGHQAGDAVLHKVAQCLRRFVRPTDLVARYGGEEFTVILPGADVRTALAVAERLRQAVRALELGTAGAAPLPGVTVSVGAGGLRQGETLDTLLRRADAALYRAKHGGRDRCCG